MRRVVRWFGPWMMAAACAPAVEEPGPVSQEVDPALEPVIVMSTAADDYSAGALSVLTPSTGEIRDVAGLYGDTRLAVTHDAVVVLEGLGADVLRRYDDLRASAPRWERSVGQGTNPQDALEVGGSWWVSLYETDALAVIDPSTGKKTGSVDLHALADADQIPEVTDLVADGTHVLVCAQQHDRDHAWRGLDHGKIGVVDAQTAELVGVFEVGPNPNLVPHPEGGALVLAEDGLYRVGWEGVLAGPHVPRGVTGVIVSAAVASDGQVAAISREADGTHHVWCLASWDATEATKAATLDNFLSDIVVLGRKAWVSARRGWADPNVAGGVFSVDLEMCTMEQHEEDWIRGTFAPFDLALWAPSEAQTQGPR